MRDEERFDARARQDQAAERPRCDDVGDGRLAENDRYLTEEVAARQSCPFMAIDEDSGLAVEDDVEPRSGESLAQDPFTLGVERLFEDVNDRRQLWIAEVGEEREPGNRIDKLFTRDHPAMVPQRGWWRDGIRVDGSVPVSAACLPSRTEDA